MADNTDDKLIKIKEFIDTLFPRYFLENISQDGDVLLTLITQELDRIANAIANMSDIVDPDRCPPQLLDYLASLFGVPFLPTASEVEKIAYVKSELAVCPIEQVYQIADVFNVDLNLYASPDEKRLACIVAADTASPEQIDQALYILGASYKLGIMTTEQKRLAIKQALSWYRVKGRERAYQILLRIYGLQADITALWTNNYQDFYDHPQGVIIEDGGDWYITPHYALDLIRYTDEGAITANILRQFTELVRNEVQPAHCVLERVSFTQVLTDYVEIKEELVFAVDVPAVDVVGWPECTWQNRGREQVEVPLRNGMVEMNRTATPIVYIDYVMTNYGRGVDQWNERFLPTKFRDNNFIQDWVYVDFFFNRADPRGPYPFMHYPELLRSQALYYRDGVHLYVPTEVAEQLDINYDETYWLRGGTMYDHNWVPIDMNLYDPGYMFPRDPYYCEKATDPFEIGPETLFEDTQTISEPRNMCSPYLRDGINHIIRDGSFILSMDDCLTIEIPNEEYIEFEDDNILGIEADDIKDYMCPEINYRDGSASMGRDDLPPYREIAVLLRDGSLLFTRDTNPYTRNYGGVLRDGATLYTRDSVFIGETYRRDNYCYTEDAVFEPTFVDECIPVDTLLDSVVSTEVEDSHNITDETQDALDFGYETHEHFCNTMFRENGVYCSDSVTLCGNDELLRDGSNPFTRETGLFECNLEHTRGLSPGSDPGTTSTGDEDAYTNIPVPLTRTGVSPAVYIDEPLCRGSKQPPRDYNWENHPPLRSAHSDDFVRDGSWPHTRDYIDTLNPLRDGSVSCQRDAWILDCDAWRRDDGRCPEDDLQTSFEFVEETVVVINAELDAYTTFDSEDVYDVVDETGEDIDFAIDIRDHYCSLAYRDLGMCPLPHTTIINPCELYRGGIPRLLRDGQDNRTRDCSADTPRVIEERYYYRGSPRLPRDYYWPGVSIRSDAMHQRDGAFQRDFIDTVGPLRDGSVVYTRDMCYLETNDGEVTYRRDASGGCMSDPFEMDITYTGEGFVDYFTYSCTVYRDTDATRYGVNVYFDRTGEGSCDRPFDTLEIITSQCRTWDSPGCRWDTGIRYDQ